MLNYVEQDNARILAAGVMHIFLKHPSQQAVCLSDAPFGTRLKNHTIWQMYEETHVLHTYHET